jgi:hypothetical protein
MLGMQLGYDALEILNFDQDLFRTVQRQLAFVAELGLARKLTQARFVARKRA